MTLIYTRQTNRYHSMPVVTKRCYCSLVKGRRGAHCHQCPAWNLELRRVLDARKANPQEWGLWTDSTQTRNITCCQQVPTWNAGTEPRTEVGNCVPNDKQLPMWNSGFQSTGGLTGKRIRSSTWHRERLGGTYHRLGKWWETRRTQRVVRYCVCAAFLVAQMVVFAFNAGDPSSFPGSGRSPGGGNGNPLQHSCLENSMDWGAL